MHVRSIILKNIGPIEDLKIEPRFTAAGQPVPLALVGQNGAGKSLALSLILDALIETRRKSFREIPEVGQTDYLRLSSKNYVRRSGQYSHAQVKLSDGVNELKFDEVISLTDFDTFQASAPPDVLALPDMQQSEFKESGFYKNLVMPDVATAAIRRLSITYFPYFRYERPHWLSEKAHIDFAPTRNLYGTALYNPVRTNVIEETKRWILNVALDRELYEKAIVPLNIQGQVINVFSGYSGPNDRIISLVNEIIFAMLRANDPSFIAARIGIGKKGTRELSVFATRQDRAEEVIAPELDQLSSGQLMALGLATEIIRAHELVHGSAPSQLDEVKGISLIDEVDLHLHISFQKTLMPLLLRKFPSVQFILTTHSPFFLLGLAEQGDLDIYNLPIGNKIIPEEFSEFEVGYDLFVKKNEQFRSRYQKLSEQVQVEGRPLIITEGKTDWQHLKRALAKFKQAGEYNDLDIEFLEFDDPATMGDEKLAQMCETSPLLKLKRKLIFVFDRDNAKIITRMSGVPSDFRVVDQAGVYSFCIPVPDHRINYEKITIEMYYQDADLRTVAPASGKRLWFSNEIQIIKHPTSGENDFRTLAAPETEDELGKWVFDAPADEITNDTGQAVGLSKAAFITTILDDNDLSGAFDRSAFRAVFNIIRAITAPAMPAPIAGN